MVNREYWRSNWIIYNILFHNSRFFVRYCILLSGYTFFNSFLLFWFVRLVFGLIKIQISKNLHKWGVNNDTNNHYPVFVD